MSIEPVKQALSSFLLDPDPAAICIKGRWGTGKTHTWKDIVRQFSTDHGERKYAYISLFGIERTSEILPAIYVNTTLLSETLHRKRSGVNLSSLLKNLRSTPGFLADHASLPYVAGLGGIVRAALANLVRDTIICFDDIERKSKEISINDIMGLISQLVDSRNCKVVLILNENNLSNNDLEEFNKYSEKVINYYFKFQPTPEDSALIALPIEDEFSNAIRIACQDLEITNIRVIRKIGIFALQLKNLLNDVDSDVLNRVLRSLVVITWSIISPIGEDAPDIEYLVHKRSSQYFGSKDTKFTDDEVRWGNILNKYGFTHCDDFDKVMIDAIKMGFFDPVRITSEIDIFLRDAEKSRAQAALEAAWKPFHESFDDNGNTVGESILNGCQENIRYLSPINLNNAILILKDIGWTEQAKCLIRDYVSAHSKDKIFEKSDNLFSDLITDPDIITAFAAEAQKAPRTLPPPLDAAKRIAGGGWSPEDEESLARLSVDDLKSLFRSTRGDDQSTVILACLKFRGFASITPLQKSINDNAYAALVQIGQENLLNARRLIKFGVKIDSDLGKNVPTQTKV